MWLNKADLNPRISYIWNPLWGKQQFPNVSVDDTKVAYSK